MLIFVLQNITILILAAGRPGKQKKFLRIKLYLKTMISNSQFAAMTVFIVHKWFENLHVIIYLGTYYVLADLPKCKTDTNVETKS